MFQNLLISSLLIVLAWVSWRYFSLRHNLKEYSRFIRRTADGEMEAHHLPANYEQLEKLTTAIRALISAYEKQVSALDDKRARLEATLTQMTDGVLIADADGRIQMTNPAAEKLFGKGELIIGKSVSMTLRHHQLIETWRKCQQSGQIQSDSVEAGSTHKFLQLIAIPDKHAGGAILLIQDLTRLRRLETVRRDFISNVSHELRTPLASLKALTETLQEGALEDPPAAQRFLGRIQTEVDALTQMTTELLDLSRMESGQVLLELKPITPKKLIQSTADRMKMQAERAGLLLQVHDDANLPLIQADFSRLEQVLVNLIHNAVKFTPPGGLITLSAIAEENHVRFSVCDTGTGISVDELTRIFERFYRVDRSRSGDGTGLGLSIARHLIDAHGGKIWAESREGEGSTFFFTIPCAGNNFT